jgi:hypothetical protein
MPRIGLQEAENCCVEGVLAAKCDGFGWEGVSGGSSLDVD